MFAIARTDALRRSDANASVPVEVLIGRAGHAVAVNALAMLGKVYGKRVLLVAGSGNNGADGRVAAGVLRSRGARVDEIAPADFRAVPDEFDLVIDAAFGTGYRESDAWNPPRESHAAVLAVDIPSGVFADTGNVHRALRADVTVTFAAIKPGLLFGDGAALAGDIVVADIGLDIPAEDQIAQWVELEDVLHLLRFRESDAHKWNHGVKVIAGSRGMTGAARLTAAAALHAGAGIVHAFVPGAAVLPTDPVEVVWHALPDEEWGVVISDDDLRFKSTVVGPGLGRADATARSAAKFAIDSPMPTVIDGDGLYAVATAGVESLKAAKAPRILTPHEGEYAMLMGSKPEPDHISAATGLAKRSGQVALLKGPLTVVADGDRAWVMECGDQRLATAGSGDVLAGVIAAMLALGHDPATAAVCGALIHGEAAMRLHNVGMTAGELPVAVSEVLSGIGQV
mgnify:FL=1